MIHYVTPQRSDDPATAPVADPTVSPPPATVDAPPGPISWELTLRQPVEAAVDPSASWDAVPHPVGPIPEPPPVTRAEAKPRTRSGDGDAISARSEPRNVDPIAATTVHSLGPVGRRRSPALAFVLALLTLGLHPIAWVRRANSEMAQFDPRMVVRPARSAAAVAVAAMPPLVVAIGAGVRIVADHLGSSPHLPLSAQVTRWFVVAPAVAPVLAVLVPLTVVALTMTLERVRVVEDRAGVDPDLQLKPAEAMWWTALPVVGLALFVTRGQRRLNRVWEICSAPSRP